MIGQIDLLPAIEDWQALTKEGWMITVQASGTYAAQTLTLVGIVARRDVPHGTIEIRVRARGERDDIVSLFKDLRTLSRLTLFGAR